MADSHGEHHSHPPYKFIFGLLCLFTGLSWLADEAQGLFPNMGFLATFVLIVATAKALCVLLYFMHLKFERNWKYVLLAPTFILACGLPLALLPDVGVHYYDVDVPQNSLADRAAEMSDDEPAADDHH